MAKMSGLWERLLCLLLCIAACQDVVQPSQLLPSLLIPQLRLFPTLLSLYDPYDDMIFMFMTHARDYHHPTTIMTLHPVFLASLWEVGGCLLFGLVHFSLPFIFDLGDIPRRTRLPLKISVYSCLPDLP